MSATWLCHATGDTRLVAEYLCHADLSTVHRYTHVASDELHAAAAATPHRPASTTTAFDRNHDQVHRNAPTRVVESESPALLSLSQDVSPHAEAADAIDDAIHALLR